MGNEKRYFVEGHVIILSGSNSRYMRRFSYRVIYFLRMIELSRTFIQRYIKHELSQAWQAYLFTDKPTEGPIY